jgi:hypothetical protein
MSDSDITAIVLPLGEFLHPQALVENACNISFEACQGESGLWGSSLGSSSVHGTIKRLSFSCRLKPMPVC